MAAILFLITYQNIQIWFKIYKYVPFIIFYPILIEFQQEGARYLKIQIRERSLLHMLTQNLTRNFSISFFEINSYDNNYNF